MFYVKKVHFLAHFSKIKKKILRAFFRKISKTSKIVFFCNKMNSFGVMETKIKKSGRVTFEPLLSPNFIPNFRKILGAVLEICRDARTHGRTHGRTEAIL